MNGNACDSERCDRITLASPRYVVTELQGWRNANEGSGPPGVSFHIIDTLWNRRLVATYRSEECRGGRYDGRVVARQRAYFNCERLNAAS